MAERFDFQAANPGTERGSGIRKKGFLTLHMGELRTQRQRAEGTGRPAVLSQGDVSPQRTWNDVWKYLGLSHLGEMLLASGGWRCG